MSGMSWFHRRGACRIQTRNVGQWHILEVHGKFVSGDPEKRFLAAIDQILDAGARQLVVDLTGADLSDDVAATAASDAYHRGRAAGAEMRFVVRPGRGGGYYHMAGLEMSIPTFSRLNGAIDF
jgi:anti-anti-sigma regulatory factor